MKNVLVVGAGFSGSIIARELAEKSNVNITVVDKRNAVGGNMYDELDEHNIRVQKYGPHVLVTNEWKVIDYLSKFSEFYKYNVKEVSLIDGKFVRLPFNFESLQQLVGPENSQQLISLMRKEYAGRDRVPIYELLNSSVKEISDFANLLYHKSFVNYCSKQWDVPTKDLHPSIMGRSAFVIGYDERYMNKDFQFLPKNGFTDLFKNLLNHKSIKVKLNENALDGLVLNNDSKEIFYKGCKVDILVFTGPIDELFNCQFGELPYRSLNIKYEWFNKERIYDCPIVSCPQAEGYTRQTEYKFLMEDYSQAKGTVIATEYPIAYKKEEGTTPFYPIIIDNNLINYGKYLELASTYKNLFLCGRLAEFKYYNMDDCILNAFNISKNILDFISKEVL